MSTRLRSSSVGSRPRPRLQRTSRAESAAALALDVRCACQFYESKSLLPERVNPVGYNAAEEFGTCVHVQARIREPKPPTESELGFQTNITRPESPKPPQTNDSKLPPEFAPEKQNDENINSTNMTSFGNRSASCANMDAQTPIPQLMRQRDPSTSSLLRKRMSEERQGFSVLNKRMSQSTVSRDRFTPQKDPSQSTILRRKMSSASFDRANSEMVSNERLQTSLQRFHSQQSRIPNERTFYHDSNDMIRNSNMEIDLPKPEFGPSTLESTAAKLEMASPLSMNSLGNRRFTTCLSSTENLPHELFGKGSVETEPDSGIDSNFVDDPPRKTDIEKQLMQNKRNLNSQNVSDEEKVKILLSKSQNANGKPDIDNDEPPVPTKRKSDHKKASLTMQPMRVVSVDNVMQTLTHLKPQSVTEMETLRPLQAQSSEYSFSKLFDSYKSPERPQSQMSNISTPDLGANFARQRDPSSSPFTQNRYKTMDSTTTTSAFRPNVTLSMDIRPSHDRLLPSAGDYPERRASEINNPQMNQAASSQFIKQKDMRTSNILNRRRRNLSQTSLGHDTGMQDDQPVNFVNTISFEKNLSQVDSDQVSPHTGTNVKLSRGVSFEYNKPQKADRKARNVLDISNMSANRRPIR